jgi:hypothetical protein
MIRLETAKRTGIDNFQLFDVSAFERNWSARIPQDFPDVVQRTEMSSIYNCHGLTFASRRTRIIDLRAVQQILSDDNWVEVSDMNSILPGDIVVYSSEEGEPNHSGIVVEMLNLNVPKICSKWGSAGEYIHLLSDCPNL